MLGPAFKHETYTHPFAVHTELTTETQRECISICQSGIN